MKWAQLPRHQIISENTHPSWVYHPLSDWVEISSVENIHLDMKYQSSDLLSKMLVDWSAAEEVLKKWRIMKKHLGMAYSGGW